METDDATGGNAGGQIVPWETDEEMADAHGRHDGFNGARKRLFLKALVKTGCLLDACRATGISHQTAYNHQDRDPEFARNCQLALKMAAADIELKAWERGVEGVEEDVFSYGKHVGVRLKRSDSILRLLLQGANRKKYGPRPGFSRKRLMKHERKQIEREVRATMRPVRDMREVRDSVLTKLAAIERHRNEERLSSGWVRLDDGTWIPPGWVRVADTAPEGDE